ncbi:MAG: hypothetical protein ACK5HA_07015 [Planctomycetaceae bacterium]
MSVKTRDDPAVMIRRRTRAGVQRDGGVRPAARRSANGYLVGMVVEMRHRPVRGQAWQVGQS